MVGQRVQEGVGRRIIALPRRSQQRGQRGEQDEEIQLPVLGQPVQIPGPGDLGTHHVLEPVPRLLGQNPIVENAGAMHHPAQLREIPLQLLERPRELNVVGDVAADNLDLGAVFFHPQEGLFGLVRGLSPAHQDQMARSPRRHPSGHLKAQSAESAGDQVAGVGLDILRTRRDRLGHGQNDLADVFRLGHETEGPDRLFDRKVLPRQQPQAPGLDVSHQLLEHRSNHLRLVDDQISQIDHVVFDRLVQLGDLGLIPNSDFADLQEAAVGRQTREALGDEFAGQRIEDDIDAPAARALEDLLGEIQGP